MQLGKSHHTIPSGGLLAAQDLSEQFAAWHEKKHPGYTPDCQFISTVVAKHLHQMGHQVRVHVGSALGSDQHDDEEPDIHWWLNVNGHHFDPKAHITKVPYTRYTIEDSMTPEDALNNSVEDPDEFVPAQKINQGMPTGHRLGKSQRSKEPRRVAAVAAYNADGLFLWGKRNDNGKWTNPGGHMEPGEEPLEAARRELEEETGLKGQDFQYLGRGLAGRDGSVLVYCYRCVVDDATIDSSDDPDEECEEWRWIEPDDIPEEISSNLHSPKNILLRLLGLQEGEVEEPMEKKADPHFVEHNPYSGSALKIPKYKTRSRKQWDQDYLTSLAHHFAGGDITRLRPVQVPTAMNMGSNMAVNKSRLNLYKRMIKAKDRLPPVVVRRNGIGYDLLDGNHRLEAARQAGLGLIHALEVIEAPAPKAPPQLTLRSPKQLKKGLPGLALVGALATGGALSAPKPPAVNEMVQQQGIQAIPWTHEGLSPDLFPIAHLESSWGKNMAHASNRKGEFHTAFGALGFKPVTAHEEYLKSKYMQANYPGLNNPEDFLSTFKQNPKFYNLLASAHFARLKGRHGGPQQAAYAWRWGTGAASKATKEQIENDAYVQKYTHMNLDQKTGQPTVSASLAKAQKPKVYVPSGKTVSDGPRPKIPGAEHVRQALDELHAEIDHRYDHLTHHAKHVLGLHEDDIEGSDHSLVPTDCPRCQKFPLDQEEIGRCTSTAAMLAKRLGGKVYGYLEEDNPKAKVAEHAGGHDFAVIGDRYIADWWASSYGDHPDLWDMHDPKQAAKIKHLYGDRKNWSTTYDFEKHPTQSHFWEKPVKKSIKDLEPGGMIGIHAGGTVSPDGHNLRGHKIFNYDHLLLDHPDYYLRVIDGPVTPMRGFDGTTLNAELRHGGATIGYAEGNLFNGDLQMRYSEINKAHRGRGLGTKMYEALFAHAFHKHGAKTISGDDHSTSASRVHQSLAEKHGMEYKPIPGYKTRGDQDSFDNTFKPYQYAIKSELAKNEEIHDPLEAMLAHDNPQERIMALRSKLVMPYHLRRALQDEDPDVRAAAAKHPMMTSALIEEALKHPDLHTREAALSRPDLQDHHLEMAIWDPELQTQAALHPGLTEEQRQKLVDATTTPEGLRTKLLAKSVGYITYPKLGQPKAYSEPMVRDPDKHAEWLHTHDKIKDLRGLSVHGAVSYNRLKTTGLADDRRKFSATVRADTESLPATVAHETQHSVFARLRQKYGHDAGEKILRQTMLALDRKDMEHLRNLTDWKIKNKYDPTKEPEERIAYLQNYLQDGLWRKSAHKAMRIHMDRNAEKIAHDWAKQIWMKLRNRAEAIGIEHIGPAKKAEDEIAGWLAKQEDHEEYNVFEDMLGLNSRMEAHIEAAKFLGPIPPDLAVFRLALLEDCDLVEAALISIGLENTRENRQAIEGVLKLQDADTLKKAEKTHEVHPMMPDGTEVADGVRRGLAADTDQEMHLDGKHSAGTMMVRDPETGQMYLLKPGSGDQSPASGARQEPANQSRREAAFWHVAEAWGLHVRVPRADLVLIDGKEVAVLHMLSFDWKNLEKLKFKNPNLPARALEKYRQTGELHKWAIMDYVLGNPDRHGQNLMVGPQKEGYPVALIDHGSAFAGSEFDPANDKNSFIPYYLRAWRGDSWGELDAGQKLRSMPTLDRNTDQQLRDWFHGINAADLEALLHRYGIDPSACVERLARVKNLLTDPDQPNFSEAINRLWLKT